MSDPEKSVLDMVSEPNSRHLVLTHLQSGKIEFLEPALELAVKNYSDPALFRKGFVRLGEYYASKGLTNLAILAYEKARLQVPFHAITVNRLFILLDKFWEDVKVYGSGDDLERLGKYIRDLIELYQGIKTSIFYMPAIKIGIKIINELDLLINRVPLRIETPVSYSINTIISVKYDYLTPDQRKAEYGKIFGEALRRILKTNRNAKKKKKTTD